MILLIWTRRIIAPLVIFRKIDRRPPFAERKSKKVSLKRQKKISLKNLIMVKPRSKLIAIIKKAKSRLMMKRKKKIKSIFLWPIWKPLFVKTSWPSLTGFLKISDGFKSCSKCLSALACQARKCAGRNLKNLNKFKMKSSKKLNHYNSIMPVSRL